MSKFCTKCGATLDDNAAFCTSCGTKFNTANAAQPAANESGSFIDKVKSNANMESIKGLQSNPNFTKYVGIGAVAIAVIIVICILVSVLTGGYMKPIEKLWDGIADKDGELYMEAYHELELKSERKKYDLSTKEQVKNYKDEAKTLYRMLKDEYGSDLKIKVKIEEKEKIDKDDLKDYEELLQYVWDKKSIKVTKGYEVDAVVEIKGDDDKDEEDTSYVVLKVNGDWCIAPYEVEDVADKLERYKDKEDGDSDDISDFLSDSDFDF